MGVFDDLLAAARKAAETRGGSASSGDPYIDSLKAAGYQVSLTPSGDLIAFKAGDRRNPSDSIRIPNYTGGGAGSSSRLASDDPRYWDFQYAQLNQDEQQFVRSLEEKYHNDGLDAESARRQALVQWFNIRGSLANNTAQTSADVAKQAAQFAANPRDTYAEALYRNQVGGSTPFGDLNNSAFGEYGKALAAKAASIFQPVAEDLNKSRAYRDAIPPLDFLSSDQQAQLGGNANGAPAQLNMNGGVGTAASVNPLSSFVGLDATQLAVVRQIAAQRNKGQFYGFDSPEEAQAMMKYFAAKGGGGVPATPPPPQGGLPSPTSGGTAPPSFIQQPTESGLIAPTVGKVPTSVGGTLAPTDYRRPVPFAGGGTLNFDGMFDRSGPGYSPSSSEGGSNLNLHERAVVVGESGHIYATLGEKRPDGSVRAEQLQIKPLKSEVQKDKRLEEGNKAVVESQKKTMASFAGGGSVTSDPSLDDMNAQYSQLLSRLGGMGGGSSTPLNGARFLAGAPASMISEDPYLKGITEASYSMKGIDPSELWAQVAKFTPSGIVNNSPRVSFV